MKNSKRFETSMTKFCIITLLNEKPSHGYEIIENIGKMKGNKPSSGQIYPLLRNLASKKYVSILSKTAGGRRRKVYFLTPLGKKFSISILNQFSDLIDSSIKAKLTVCAHCNCNVYKGGVKKRIKGKNLDFCCENCAKVYIK